MGLRAPGAGSTPAAQHAPEGTSGQDLSDFDSAFGDMFTSDPAVPATQSKPVNKFADPDDDEDEELDEDKKPTIEAKPPEKDPLEGLEEAQRNAKDKWRLQKELKELKEQVALLTKPAAGNKDPGANPLKGKTQDEIINLAMAAMDDDGLTEEQADKKLQTMSTDEIIKKAKEEMRKEMQEENVKSEGERRAEQAISTFKKNIDTHITEKGEAYPVLAGLGGTDHVYAMIEKDYLAKEEEFGQEYAQKHMMKIEDAAKKVNETLASEVRKALKSPHMKKFILELAKDGGDSDSDSNQSQDEFAQLEDQGSRTLTNSVHRRVTDPKDMRTLTNEEALAQSFAYLND